MQRDKREIKTKEEKKKRNTEALPGTSIREMLLVAAFLSVAFSDITSDYEGDEREERIKRIDGHSDCRSESEEP